MADEIFWFFHKDQPPVLSKARITSVI